MKKRFRILLVLFVGLTVFATGCGPGSGDRVLVAKYIYDSGLSNPQRFDVVVFRYPEEPLKGQIPTNYIKRLLGLAGETIAIFFGQLFFNENLDYPNEPRPDDPLELWDDIYMYQDNEEALKSFRKGQFTIIRKKPQAMMALRRIVYNNDYQAKDLKGVLPPRWAGAPKSAWVSDDNKGFSHDGSGQEVQWLNYRHILRPFDWPEEGSLDYDVQIQKIKERVHSPKLITDFLAYNSFESFRETRFLDKEQNWVGDLMLDFELTVDDPTGEFWVELSHGVDRFQARWDLETGICTLFRVSDDDKIGTKELGSKPTSVNAAGTYQIRFANFDQRLTVWVNRSLPFGHGTPYEAAWHYDKDQGRFVNIGPTENDLKPANIGSKGAAIKVHHLSLYRDTYYTIARRPQESDANFPRPHEDPAKWDFWANPEKWDPLRNLEIRTMYVQPGHYLVLGDNSPASSDSRTWGLVPERLMLGRALVVYYPLTRIGPIR